MKIEKIKKTKSGKYNLILDNKDNIVTYDDVILKNNLLYSQDINHKLLEQVMKDTNYFDIYNKTIKYISIKMRSEKEIETFLSKYNLDLTTINKIIKDLKAIGFINDNSFVKAYINDRIYLSNSGPLKIKQELKEHDINDDLIEEVLSLIDKTVVEDKLNKLISKKINANHKYSNYMLKQKLIMELVNLGYEKDLIILLIDQNLISGNDILENTYEKIYSDLSRKYEGNILYKKVKEKLYQKGFDINEINELINKKNSM
jgi:regulatory protein